MTSHISTTNFVPRFNIQYIPPVWFHSQPKNIHFIPRYSRLDITLMILIITPIPLKALEQYVQSGTYLYIELLLGTLAFVRVYHDAFQFILDGCSFGPQPSTEVFIQYYLKIITPIWQLNVENHHYNILFFCGVAGDVNLTLISSNVLHNPSQGTFFNCIVKVN